MGRHQLEVLKGFDGKGLICLLPLADLCNNIQPQTIIEKEVKFNLLATKDYLHLKVGKPFKKGEEYNYSYQLNLSNEHLLSGYGFLIKITHILMPFLNLVLILIYSPKKKLKFVNC